MKKNIITLRKKIDKIDEKIIKYYMLRLKVVEEIAKEKKKVNEKIINLQREKEIFDNINQKLSEKKEIDLVIKLYKLILKESKNYQREITNGK